MYKGKVGVHCKRMEGQGEYECSMHGQRENERVCLWLDERRRGLRWKAFLFLVGCSVNVINALCQRCDILDYVMYQIQLNNFRIRRRPLPASMLTFNHHLGIGTDAGNSKFVIPSH